MSASLGLWRALFGLGVFVSLCSGAAKPRETTFPISKESLVSEKALVVLREGRRETAHRQRRLIFNNDGGDWRKGKAATPEAFLARRTTPLLGSQVDSIFYSTTKSSGFGIFSHNTKIGQIWTSTDNPNHPGNNERRIAPDRTGEFIEQGTDPLKIMVECCRANRTEIFWSMRMNDTHDAWYRDREFSKFKKDHPEWLVSPPKPGATPGSKDVNDYDRSKRGGWTAMDFNHQEVRDLAVRFIEEVCENYDVDGIEMDFFRHLIYFKGPAWGIDATAEELAKLTDMVRQVREVTERIGLRRGRPILVAVRVPDSAEFCKALGIDIEHWLADGLVDIMAVSDYFRLNPWTVSSALGHKYNVPVYACLSETRLVDAQAAEVRRSVACYRGRAAEAWTEGVDGIYLFNAFDPRSPLWRELGDAGILRELDKTYVVGTRGVKVIKMWMTKGQERFLNRPILSPDRPVQLDPGKPASIEMKVFGLPAKHTDPVRPMTLRIRVDGCPASDALQVAFNGNPLAAPRISDVWLDYPLAPSLVKEGVNQIEVALKPGTALKATWLDVVLSTRTGHVRTLDSAEKHSGVQP